MKKGTYISLLAGYAVAVAVYGMWQHFGLPLLPLVFALPVFYLAVVSLVPTKWHGSFMSLGLLMSAAGDYCGESGMFLLQASFSQSPISFMRSISCAVHGSVPRRSPPLCCCVPPLPSRHPG